MSKIICEICGTVYPDNATMCPICGCPRNSGEEVELPAEEEVAAGTVRTTQRVKGGRFSNKNVKKRNQSGAAETTARPAANQTEEKEKSNRGLLIAILILLAAVILMSVVLFSRFFGGAAQQDKNPTTTGSTPFSAPTVETGESSVPCTDLDIAGIDLEQGVRLKGVGKSWRMAVTAVPEDSTDEITYTSSDDSIVAIEVNGKRIDLVCMAPGSATITVACGLVSKEFTVSCEEAEATSPTEETTGEGETAEPTTEPPTVETTEPTEAAGLSLNRSDITFMGEGETFTFEPGKGISPAQCTWSSDDESVATIDNGRVTAVAPGTTEITVEFNGQSASCIIRCNWDDETEPTEDTQETEETEGTEPEETSGSDDDTWEISHTDVTLRVDESFTLTLRSSSGETADVSWTVYNWRNGGEVSVSGNTVTGVNPGESSITCVYNGVEYKCVVHIK